MDIVADDESKFSMICKNQMIGFIFRNKFCYSILSFAGFDREN